MGARRKTVKRPAARRPMPEGLGWVNRRLLTGMLVIGLMAGVLVSGGWWLAQADTLPIQRVQVEGEFRYLSREDLSGVIGELSSGGFFNVDVHALKEAAESLSWVDTASVRRQWPDTLKISITEQQALAYWGNDGLVNVRGEVFVPPAGNMPADLPRFSGPVEVSRLVAARYQQLSAQLAKADLRIKQLDLSSRRAWQVGLDNGINLVLGRVVNDQQINRFVRVYQQRFVKDAAEMKSVDLRYSNGFAVHWKDKDKV